MHVHTLIACLSCHKIILFNQTIVTHSVQKTKLKNKQGTNLKLFKVMLYSSHFCQIFSSPVASLLSFVCV